VKDPIALITGSSRGVGLAIAKMLDKRGIKVILTGRSQIALNYALTQLTSKQHQAFSVDFSNQDEVNHFLNRLVENVMIPNMLIHNVGGTLAEDTFPLNINIVKETINLNLDSALKVNEKFLPYMIENKFGRIVHIGSDASLTGQASPAYVIAKAALNGYVKSAARFYAKHGIMICAVLPGILEHEGSAWTKKKITNPIHYQSKLDQMPLGRFGMPEEIASMVAELITSDSMMCAGALLELCGAVV